jgi:hypothetical protein
LLILILLPAESRGSKRLATVVPQASRQDKIYWMQDFYFTETLFQIIEPDG